MSVCVCVCDCAFSLHCCVSAPWQRSKVFQAPIRSGCEMADGGGRGGGKVDLLATINIKLLYRAPVDNIKGLADQSKQSSFIKKGLGGVGGRQR